MANLFERMVRAAKLDPTLYEEVEADASATGQALTVVVLSSVAAGLGAGREGGALGLVAGLLAALLGWVVWAFLTYLIGTKLLAGPKTRANLGELLRTTGFASTPGVVRLIGAFPGLATISHVVAAIWMLVAFVVAVRQALDYESTGRAVLVCVIGFAVYLGVAAALGAILIAATGGLPNP
jgi:hypothetical protein